MPKRILILTADAGFGHRSAANAILTALSERYDVTAEIVNPLAQPGAPALLKFAETNYDREVQNTPELYAVGYQVSDHSVAVSLMEQGLIALLYKPLKDLVDAARPDAIISTYPLYQAPLAALFALNGRYVPVLVVVTDLATVHGLWFHDDIDLCLVPTEQVRAKALDSGLPPERVTITGLPVNPTFAQPYDQIELRTALGWSNDRTVALFAGSKRVTKLEPIAHALNHSGLPLELALVSGQDEALFKRWQAEEWHQPAHIYSFVKNMPDLIRAADLVVCKAGGLIVSEALAAGRPLLIAEAIPGQETGNAMVVVEGGAGEMIDSGIEALETVCHWLEHDRALLTERGVNACKLGRSDAAYRVAELAYNAAHSGVQKRDHRLLGSVAHVREIVKTQASSLVSESWSRIMRII